MKKVLKAMLVSSLIFTAMVTNASEKVSISDTEPKKVHISFDVQNEREDLVIKDVFGEALFAEVINKGTKFRKAFDLSTVPAGVYYTEIKNSRKVEIIPIIITDTNALIVKDSAKNYSAPNISVDGKTARITVNNFHEDNVHISISNESEEEVHVIDSKNLLVYKKLDFSELGSGTYDIHTIIGNYSFDYSIDIE